MGVKRRGFLKIALATGAALAAPAARLLEGVLPTRWVEALRAGRPAIPVRQLRAAGIRKPAKWAG